VTPLGSLFLQTMMFARTLIPFGIISLSLGSVKAMRPRWTSKGESDGFSHPVEDRGGSHTHRRHSSSSQRTRHPRRRREGESLPKDDVSDAGSNKSWSEKLSDMFSGWFSGAGHSPNKPESVSSNASTSSRVCWSFEPTKTPLSRKLLLETGEGAISAKDRWSIILNVCECLKKMHGDNLAHRGLLDFETVIIDRSHYVYRRSFVCAVPKLEYIELSCDQDGNIQLPANLRPSKNSCHDVLGPYESEVGATNARENDIRALGAVILSVWSANYSSHLDLHFRTSWDQKEAQKLAALCFGQDVCGDNKTMHQPINADQLVETVGEVINKRSTDQNNLPESPYDPKYWVLDFEFVEWYKSYNEQQGRHLTRHDSSLSKLEGQ
jgi:hypothetical protein